MTTYFPAPHRSTLLVPDDRLSVDAAGHTAPDSLPGGCFSTAADGRRVHPLPARLHQLSTMPVNAVGTIGDCPPPLPGVALPTLFTERMDL